MSSTPTAKVNHRKLVGTVVSKKSDKTAIVAVTRTVIHPKYGKRAIRTARFAAHDPLNRTKEGDVVTLEECRPISKTKRWRVVYKAFPV